MQWLRPVTLQFYKCENVSVENITIIDAPFWTIHPVFSKNVYFSKITINNPLNAPNTDGIDPESCDGVIISDCNFFNGDDCIAIKSGIDLDGRNYNIPTKNLSITGCIFSSRHAAIAIGSEMSGGVENVLIADCIIPQANNGINVKSRRGRGGYVRNVTFRNILMNDIKNTALTVNMFYHEGDNNSNTHQNKIEEIPLLSHIYFSDIVVDSCVNGIELRGITESKVHHIDFRNIDIQYASIPLISADQQNNRFNFVTINGKPILAPAAN